jgi:hypothetical protein
VTTLEYRPIESKHPSVSTLTITDLQKWFLLAHQAKTLAQTNTAAAVSSNSFAGDTTTAAAAAAAASANANGQKTAEISGAATVMATPDVDGSEGKRNQGGGRRQDPAGSVPDPGSGSGSGSAAAAAAAGSEWTSSPSPPLFDAVVSHSSLEHSGLGRYGDPLNPWGDLVTMARAWCVAKPNEGKLLLGVPYLDPHLQTTPAATTPPAAATMQEQQDRERSPVFGDQFVYVLYLSPAVEITGAVGSALSDYFASLCVVFSSAVWYLSFSYNAHRIYSSVRYPHLVANWQLLEDWDAPADFQKLRAFSRLGNFPRAA